MESAFRVFQWIFVHLRSIYKEKNEKDRFGEEKEIGLG